MPCFYLFEYTRSVNKSKEQKNKKNEGKNVATSSPTIECVYFVTNFHGSKDNARHQNYNLLLCIFGCRQVKKKRTNISKCFNYKVDRRNNNNFLLFKFRHLPCRYTSRIHTLKQSKQLLKIFVRKKAACAFFSFFLLCVWSFSVSPSPVFMLRLVFFLLLDGYCSTQQGTQIDISTI